MNLPWERIHCWPWVHLMYHDQSDKIIIWIIPREWTRNSRQRVLLWFFFAVTGFSEVGGYEGLKDKYMMAVSNDTLYSNSSCGRPREDSFVMLRDPINSDMPWAGFIFGQTIASIWYWCADQVSFVPFSEIFYMLVSSFLEIDFAINISDKKSRRFDLSEVIFKCIKVL